MTVRKAIAAKGLVTIPTREEVDGRRGVVLSELLVSCARSLTRP
jgi:hypothetical protein